MKTKVLGITLVLFMLAMSGTSMAAFVNNSCAITFQDDPNLEKHSYSFDYINDPNNNYNSRVAMNEGPVYETGADPSLTCVGDIDSDPTLMIDEDAFNDSGVAWTAWLLELDPNGSATFVVNASHTPSSDQFNTYSLINSKTLEFYAPDSVHHGESVNLVFFINVPFSGTPGIPDPFSFTLTQTIIPEPATLTLLGLGALAFIRRNKRS